MRSMGFGLVARRGQIDVFEFPLRSVENRRESAVEEAEVVDIGTEWERRGPPMLETEIRAGTTMAAVVGVRERRRRAEDGGEQGR
ncbi:hypothetical protein E3N88_28132 [Mikania micrantha]|uniref:Uncharacterized protein n=1 Tax=Mikania micrantha TaxID=192012 RepID=A0A5N6MZ89_9ASTR|nr:hypothetical protein E3N88_28132 [Mikania micrantha]